MTGADPNIAEVYVHILKGGRVKQINTNDDMIVLVLLPAKRNGLINRNGKRNDQLLLSNMIFLNTKMGLSQKIASNDWGRLSATEILGTLGVK